MSISIDSSRLDLSRFNATARIRETGAMEDGLGHLRDVAASRAPVLTGALRASGFTLAFGMSGKVVFPLIYAAKQERRDWQKHPQGGQSRYLKSAFDTETDEVMRIIGEKLFR
jgi:hypothetical protein